MCHLCVFNFIDSYRKKPLYYPIIQTHLKKYSSVVDGQNMTTGLNNYAGPIKSCLENSKNYSREWKSHLNAESILEMSEFKSLLSVESKFSSEPFPTLATVQHTPTTTRKPTPISAPPSHLTTSCDSTPSSSSLTIPGGQPQPSISEGPIAVSNRAGNFQYNVPHKYSEPGISSLEISNEAMASGVAATPPKKAGRKQSSYVPWRKRKRCGHEDEEDLEELPNPQEERGGTSSFITAKDQYVINQNKKKGCGQGKHYRPSNMHDEALDTGTINCGNYGNNKRSLGTRRAPGSKFVPPVKKSTEEEEDQAINEKIRSRVLCNNSNKEGRGGASGEGEGVLPPELEGDERLKNIEPKMVELIMNEIMDHGAPVQWDDIAGLEFAKATIKEIVVWPMLRPDIFKGLRGPPKGILLFGPPGTGKTLIGKCIASQVQATFFSISASSLTSKWVGEGEKMVRALFAVSRCYQPAVVFIDEIDSLLSQRSDSEHESSRRIKTEFLVQLDGATTSDDDRLLVIGATNRPQEIDEAARRRLVKRLYIPLPDCPARRQIVTNLLKDQSFELTEEEMTMVCDKTEGYSGADMTNLCREAALGPIRDAAHDIQNIAVDQETQDTLVTQGIPSPSILILAPHKQYMDDTLIGFFFPYVRPVRYCDFEEAFHSIRPSVSKRDLDLYISWNQAYGCNSRR